MPKLTSGRYRGRQACQGGDVVTRQTAAPELSTDELAVQQLARAAKLFGIELPVVVLVAEPTPDAVSKPVSYRAAQKARMSNLLPKRQVTRVFAR